MVLNRLSDGLGVFVVFVVFVVPSHSCCLGTRVHELLEARLLRRHWLLFCHCSGLVVMALAMMGGGKVGRERLEGRRFMHRYTGQVSRGGVFRGDRRETHGVVTLIVVALVVGALLLVGRVSIALVMNHSVTIMIAMVC